MDQIWPCRVAEVSQCGAGRRYTSPNPCHETHKSVTDQSFVAAIGPGTVLGGDYRIEQVSGAGAQGQVFLSQHALGPRAVKLLKAELTDDPKALARLREEAQLATGLRHEGICAVYDFREDETYGWFIAMEHVEGVSLGAILDRQASHRLPPETARHILKRLAEAMAHAHSRPRPVVHRDLKPDNVLVTGVGYDADATALLRAGVKILDFGLAGVSGSDEAAKASGTLPYMAPEQLDGGSPAATADVWSLGVVLYEMLAGALPFKGSDTAAQIRAASFPPLPDSVPSVLRDVVGRCLRRDPASRPQNAGELLALLDRPTEVAAPPIVARPVAKPPKQPPTPAPPPPPPPRKSPIPGIGLAIGLAAVVIGGIVFMRPGPQPNNVSPDGNPVGVAPARQTTEASTQVGLRTEDGRTQYQIGETATLLIEAGATGSLSVFAFSADDVATLVWPTSGAPSAVSSGQVVRLTLPATEPPGRDVIAAVITPQSVTLPSTGRLSHQDVQTALQLPGILSDVARLRDARADAGSGIVSSPRGYALLLLETVRP